jgi:hypothetical protein
MRRRLGAEVVGWDLEGWEWRARRSFFGTEIEEKMSAQSDYYRQFASVQMTRGAQSAKHSCWPMVFFS